MVMSEWKKIVGRNEKTLVWTRGKIDGKKWMGVWNFEKKRVFYLSEKNSFFLKYQFWFYSFLLWLRFDGVALCWTLT
jgi:hypothetical protein